MLGVVGVESEFDEGLAVAWVVIGDGCPVDAAWDDAHGVAGEDCFAECAVSSGVVDPVAAPGLACLGGVLWASASRAVKHGRASVDVADLHRVTCLVVVDAYAWGDGSDWASCRPGLGGVECGAFVCGSG